MVPDNKEFLFQVLDMFPSLVEVFEPNGTAVFLNRTGLKLLNISDSNLVIGKYNLLDDPVCNDQLGLREGIRKAFFHGKAHSWFDVVAPIQDLVDRGVAAERPFEKSFMDFHLYPIKNGEKLIFVVFVCDVKKLYRGRPDLARAKEYLDTHWQGELDPKEIAKSVNMSVTQLYRLFKEHTGMTPGDYHKKVKVERIKEKLADRNLSIKEAFAACGEDSRGNILRIFKGATGLTPTQWRGSLP